MTGVRRRASRILAAAATVGLPAVMVATGAGAAEQATAEGVALASSASCEWGDIDITYRATGAQRRTVSFTAEDGTVLRAFEGKTYDPSYAGPEHVLVDAPTPPPPGTVLGVYVTVGTSPPEPATSAEFFVLYRCDALGDEAGGTNTVLSTCHGDVGTCPTTAAAALAEPALAPPGAAPGADPGSAGGPAGPDRPGSPDDDTSGGGGTDAGSGPGGSFPARSAAGLPTGTPDAGSIADGAETAAGPIRTDDDATTPLWAIGLAAVVVAAIAGGLVLRRRQHTPEAP